MMKYLTILLSLAGIQLFAQNNSPRLWINFDPGNCEIRNEITDPTISFLHIDSFSCGCGVIGGAIKFDGNDDALLLVAGQKIDESFSAIDFSLSFYFKPLSVVSENRVLFAKQNNCETDSSFVVSYNPGNQIMTVQLNESAGLNGSIISKPLPRSCWYHAVVVRKGATTLLYVNGKEQGRINAPNSHRVNISNSRPLFIGSGDCNSDKPFVGYMDEIRLYNKALSFDDVNDLYFPPDQIDVGNKITGTKDTAIYEGDFVKAYTTHTCADKFVWKPSTGVSNDTIPNPILSPTQTTTYALTFITTDECDYTDSLRIEILDPNAVDCNDIMLPTAFTPNDDGLNDRYGISNPAILKDFISMEIYDRWGNIVFSSSEKLNKWDGYYRGSPVNPGVFLYKIRYLCQGKESIKTGSVTVLR
ncbi:MAG: gliding motility-associated C-terminal domain-containing protein [Lewinellaceae bacterium]|nr:gliding motility-associated C-terminal domain-containing protein [Saprospiraceae bacterium]MCB9337889.1 gliding motility-associated C-terminal domain-containing protein [Lewinellaceae bacterium]